MFARGKSWPLALAAVLVFAGASFAAAYSSPTGNYRGTFIGDDYGSFLVDVNPDGSITGVVHSNVSFMDMEVTGTCAPDGDCDFTTVGNEAIHFYFLGKIDFMNRFIGKWAYLDNSARGSFYGMIQKD
ncbi:MAG: hypothetical protein Q7I97_01100 [Thermovirgaceae bacterium]|nr:hypothetical protein [Thermovirgaceae bacterium]